MVRLRLDVLLVQRGLAETREKAQRVIRAGEVYADGQPASKPGHTYDDATVLRVNAPPPFVGRGGEKLQTALDRFALSVHDLACLDVGASTGGFTDCLLQRGARRVYAVDVGRGQMHGRLRQDPRVVPMEGMNARYLKPADIPEAVDFACVDVSFISLTLILPAVKDVAAPGAHIVTLIKPQFEAGRRQVGRGGVVRDESVRVEIVARIRAFGESELGLAWRNCIPSPLLGPAGNVEFLAWWTNP